MAESDQFTGVDGLVVEAVEWLPSGSDAGLLRVRARWADPGAGRVGELPVLRVLSGPEEERFESLPDARFGRDPAAWRGTYLVPAALMDPARRPRLRLAWADGAEAALPLPVASADAAPDESAPSAAEPRGGEVIDRAVLAERRARRAEAAERTQARRADDALRAVHALERRSAELERRLEALQAERPAESPGRAESVAQDASGSEPTTSPPAGSESAASGAETASPPVASDPAESGLLPVSSPAPDGDPSARSPEPDSAPAASASRVSPASDRGAPASLVDPPDRPEAVDPAPYASPAGAPESSLTEPAPPDAGDRGAQEALASAQAALVRLRRAAHDQRLRLRTVELQRAADAVALAALRGDPASTQALRGELAARRAELAAAVERADAADAEVAEARRQAAEQVTAAQRRAAADAAAVRERAAAELRAERDATAAAHAEAGSARAELSAALETLEHERTAHRRAAERLAAGAAEWEAVAAELAAVRAELGQVRDDSAGRVRRLSERLAAMERAVAAERARRVAVSTELAAARAQLAVAEATHHAESVARAGLEAQLDHERAAREALSAALEQARSALAAAPEPPGHVVATAPTELRDLEAKVVALEAALADERAARAAAEEALDAERTARAAAEAALESERAARTAAEAPASVLARIAEIERAPAGPDLDRRAAEQAAAAAAVRPPAESAGRVSAALDAAAAALRERAAATEASEAAAGGPAVAAAPAADVSPPAGDDVLVPSAPAADGADALVPSAPAGDASSGAGRPTRPTRVIPSLPVAARPDTRLEPLPDRWLRQALVRMAHQDPATAARLMLGMLPALRAVAEPPLDFDLTIRGTGTFAVSLGPATWSIRRMSAPRSRRSAAYHVAGDVTALAELVAGTDVRVARWRGAVCVRGRRRDASTMIAALRDTGLGFRQTVIAGAAPPPDVVLRAFAHVIDPAWTRGHRFTVAQQVTGATPAAVHVLVRDGARVVVQRSAPPGGADASVTMGLATFTALLRGDAPPGGTRPVVRGDRRAVALLKAWTERAQGLGA